MGRRCAALFIDERERKTCHDTNLRKAAGIFRSDPPPGGGHCGGLRGDFGARAPGEPVEVLENQGETLSIDDMYEREDDHPL